MSSYAKLPEDAPEERKRHSEKESTDAEVIDRIGRGVRTAARTLGPPTGTEVEGLIAGTDLPSLEGDEPLRELAMRLDREADLWRNLAFRELARGVWMQKLMIAVSLLVLLAECALVALASLGVIFGDDGTRAPLLIASALVLLTALGALFAIVSVQRHTQHRVADQALRRADLAELRLHRIAFALTWEKVDRARLGEALIRLERDAAQA
jgi:hypothetical protein